MRKMAAGFAVAALLLAVAGCPDPQKITDLQKQVADAQMQITELEGTMQRLTAERDSLLVVVTELETKAAAKTPAKTPAAPAQGTRQPLPPTKK